MFPQDSREAVAARLEAVRLALKIKTRREFAQGAGVSEQSYSDWMRFRKDVSKNAADKFTAAYGLSLDFIFRGNKDALPHRIAKDL